MQYKGIHNVCNDDLQHHLSGRSEGRGRGEGEKREKERIGGERGGGGREGERRRKNFGK